MSEEAEELGCIAEQLKVISDRLDELDRQTARKFGVTNCLMPFAMASLGRAEDNLRSLAGDWK
ncbi:hypothetical protein [Saccharopolyspora phatthalungensis]|uniref:Uncharacterized protein n=1 Tax=Saccharopolyspora phatthalungensis TaxID=664693 RepID=A0A840Q8T3_9PSEU|nr:hypothetical protein [Saccharopolyspora phatthalungensis]MBB5153183.1 hypothetical protein [Saccharopolyspora phatthalungensis]